MPSSETMQVNVRESITHTFDINQVQVPQTPDRDLYSGCHDRHCAISCQENGDHHQADANETTPYPDMHAQSEPPMSSELLHVMKRQEVAWENAEAAVHQLDRRLRFLERSDSLSNASTHLFQDNSNNFTSFPAPNVQGISPVPSGSPQGPYIYVSPMYDDKRGTIMYRTQLVEDGPYGFRARCLADRNREDDKDSEIKRLRLDLQRQDLEMRRLKADVHKLRALEFDDDRNVIFDKFVDKVNTVTSSTRTICRPQSYHEGLHCVKTGSSSSHVTSDSSAESPKGCIYTAFGDGLSDGHCGTSPTSNLGSKGNFKPVLERFLRRGQREHSRAPSAGSELERCISASECSDNPSTLQQVILSLASTMQASFENLCNSIKACETRDSDSSKIDSGAMDDELFILKKTLSRLQDVCQEGVKESLNSEARNAQLEADKGTIDGMLHQLARAELKVISLESSFSEKERRIEDLESRLHALLKERDALMIEKYEFTNVIHEMQQDAAEQRHRIEELLSINEELLEISQAEEDKLGTFQETRDKLLQQVVQYEDNCANFECLLQEKEKEVDELNRRLKAGQIGADSIIFEKFELLSKIQAIQTESEEQKKRIDELVSINEELLEFAQSKEDQVTYLGTELDRFRAECESKGVNTSEAEANKEEETSKDVKLT